MSTKIDEATVAFNRNTLSELVGEYTAKGSSKHGEVQLNLASLIFREGDIRVDVEKVEIVKVELDSGNGLRCVAIASGQIVGYRSFREGTDFEFKDGAIPIRGKIDDLGMGQPGAVHIGLGYSNGKLLRLKSGSIVYREVGTAVGVILIVPFAVMTEGDVVFHKIR